MSCFCPICYSHDLTPVPFALSEGAGGPWYDCQGCGSQVAGHGYPENHYTPRYECNEVAATGGPEERKNQVRSNCQWYVSHHKPELPKTFLDVGCCDGAALAVMQDEFGYRVHGFDVFEPSYMGPHITVAPEFNRWLFLNRFAAVMCREVIEHVKVPQRLLYHLWCVCEPDGLVQVQTPRPTPHENRFGHQRQHLFLIHPDRLKRMLMVANLDVIEEKHWQEGQAYLCRAR